MAERAYDVAVIGAGPAGIAAAVRAAGAGASVVLIDEAPRPGGQIWRHVRGRPLPRIARRWLHRLDEAEVDLLMSTALMDAVPGWTLRLTSVAAGDGVTADAPGGATALSVAADVIILATGARERLLPFPGWTLPGVFAAGGMQALVKSGLHVRGRRVVVAGTGPLLLATAAALARAGARVVTVAEQAPRAQVAAFTASLWRSPVRLVQGALLRAGFAGARYRTGTWVAEALPGEPPRAAADRAALRAVVLTDGRRRTTVPCDLLCVGYSLLSATELGRLLGCLIHRGAVACDEAQRTTEPGVFGAGEVCGVAGFESAFVEGEIAGLAAAGAEPPGRLLRARDDHARFGRRLEAAFALRPELRDVVTPDTLVCRCMDVRHGDLRGFGSVREAKLFTRTGMGACQGRVCGSAQQFLYGWSADSVRPPVVPSTIAAMIHESAGPGEGG
jgi:D-hydroxyproline dehydrogenase subunit alpha